MAWERNNKLQLAGVIIAVLAIIIGAVTVVAPQKVGCVLGLTSCPPSSADRGRAPSSQGGSAPAGLMPTATPPGILAAPADPSLPYSLLTPPTYPASGQPVVSLSPRSLVNRGTYVAIIVSGSGFTKNGSVRITWNMPDGGTFYGTSAYPVDDNGKFEDALFWHPMRGLGMQGNDGQWQLSFQDSDTGKVVTTYIQVRSDATTPPEAQWPAVYNLQPNGPPTVRVTTTGNLCTGDGELSQVDISGFAPNADLSLYFLLPDGRYETAAGEIADALGGVDSTQFYWRIAECIPGKEFRYDVLVTDPDTGRSATAPLVLSTS
jgi:hypothetical protein